jgi:hypothetical protein
LGLRLKEHRAIRKSSRARQIMAADPYENMYMQIMVNAAVECEDEYLAGLFPVRETLAFLCDSHDKSVNVNNVYDKLKFHNPSSALWMGSLSYMNNEDSPALQAADLLASHCKDALVEEVKHPPGKRPLGKAFRERMKGLLASFRVWDMNTLKMLIDANLPPQGKFSIYSTEQMTLAKDFI